LKAKSFYLTRPDVVKNCINEILSIIPDGKLKVTISNAGTKSDKQRGLQWQWNEDVAKSGIGGKYEDTDIGVHRRSKYFWAIPIFCRDDDFFNDLCTEFKRRHEGDPERIMWFVDQYVSTEKFSVSQMAEYLTQFQKHYLSKGVNLTDPDYRGLLD
jgi:hypothetical protein